MPPVVHAFGSESNWLGFRPMTPSSQVGIGPDSSFGKSAMGHRPIPKLLSSGLTWINGDPSYGRRPVHVHDAENPPARSCGNSRHAAPRAPLFVTTPISPLSGSGIIHAPS